jgi:large subunit ribosomal protein L13
VDAKDQILGRLATRIALILQGKHKPIFSPAADCGDYVVVENAAGVMVTGKKAEQKVYRHHTGYPGGLRTVSFRKMMSETPEKVLLKAVSGMLPKNRLRKERLSRLKVFPAAAPLYDANIAKSYI